MTSLSNTHKDSRIRTYDRLKSIVFLKTREAFGGLSNMAGGFPLRVNGVRILTSEALYQACRFPHIPEVQRLIIGQVSPMTAKMKSKPYRSASRPDWNQVRVKIMRWCLRVKLAQNWAKFSELLLATGDLPIVEESRRDDFWGAKPINDYTLVGVNVLGRLLMELREEVRNSNDHKQFMHVEPLLIPDFLLNSQPIQPVVTQYTKQRTTQTLQPTVSAYQPRTAVQANLFSQSSPSVHAVLQGPKDKEGHTPIHELKPYQAYKDSGVPWLGDVPVHWEIRRNGRLFAQRNETAFPDLPVLEVSLATGVRVRTFDDSSRKQLMSDRDKYKRACRGDIAYNMMRMWQGAVGVATADGLVSPAYIVAKPLPGTEPRYFVFLFRTAAYMGEVNNYSRGIVSDRNRLYWDDFKQIASPYPSPEEQAAIVRFLDQADLRIRRYIRAKQKLITLLNEQKQAIIHCAVTRGLTPNVRLKPSGIKWLRYIPQHWNETRVKRLARSGAKTFTDGDWIETPYITENGVRLIQTGNIGIGEYKEKGFRYVSEDTFLALKCTEVEANDVLICRLDGPVGRACLAPQLGTRMITSVDNTILKVDKEVDPRYIVHVMSSPGWLNWISAICRAGGGFRYRISRSMLGNALFPLPPLSEQRAIVASIDQECGAIIVATRQAREEINLLREYRTRLIADVVTGKLDVREAAARLEYEEPEPPDETEMSMDDDTDEASFDEVPEEAA